MYISPNPSVLNHLFVNKSLFEKTTNTQILRIWRGGASIACVVDLWRTVVRAIPRNGQKYWINFNCLNCRVYEILVLRRSPASAGGAFPLFRPQCCRCNNIKINLRKKSLKWILLQEFLCCMPFLPDISNFLRHFVHAAYSNKQILKSWLHVC